MLALSYLYHRLAPFRPPFWRPAPGVFFFQAEDGIRDIGVTGVQTCALPISGETVGCDDTAMDPRIDVELCARVGARSVIVVPLYREGRAVAVLHVVSPQAHAFDDTDVQTLQLMAGFIANALRHAADFEAMRTVIADRTAALAALQESEARLRTVIGNAPIVLYALDAAGVFTLCDGRALHEIGYNPDT